MYDYLFWNQEAHSALRFEHALQAQSSEKNWEYLILIKEKNQKIRYLGSRPWDAFFYGMKCQKLKQAPALPAMPYFVRQSSLLPIKRPIQFRDRQEETQILPMNTVLEHFLKQEEACLLFQWRKLSHSQQNRLLKKAKHPCFQAHRGRDQKFTRYWVSHPVLSTLFQSMQAWVHRPKFYPSFEDHGTNQHPSRKGKP